MSYDEGEKEVALAPPRRSAHLEGIGGILRVENSDFQVEEIPAYDACGDGDYLYVSLEKRGLSHGGLVQHLCRTLNLTERDLGWAGMKDTHAVTRQVISMPLACADHLQSLEREDLKVLEAKPHTNRLKRGHLHGNKFRIRVRELPEGALERVTEIYENLAPIGFPNYFGPQRFGYEGRNVEQGLSLLDGLKKGRRLKRGFRTEIRLNAVQSWLFNRMIKLRMDEGVFEKPLEGDVLKKRDTGGMFTVEDLASEEARVQAGELSITGPIYGRRMWWPEGPAKALEEKNLEDSGLSIEVFARAGKTLRGTRRAINLWPKDVSIQQEEGDLWFEFTLPSGAYATVFLREFMGAVREKDRSERVVGLEGKQ